MSKNWTMKLMDTWEKGREKDDCQVGAEDIDSLGLSGI